MSEASERGKQFERKLALRLRQKGFKAFRDKRSGAGAWYKADIASPGFDWHIEAKSQDRVSVKDSWAQTIMGCSSYKLPVLMIEDLGNYGDAAVLRIEDFLNLIKQVKDDTETIVNLRNRV